MPKGHLVNPITWEAGGLLTVAVRHNRPDILELLLEFGFDPDERVRSGEGDGIAYSQGFRCGTARRWGGAKWLKCYSVAERA